jgi:hypothetical protein
MHTRQIGINEPVLITMKGAELKRSRMGILAMLFGIAAMAYGESSEDYISPAIGSL